MRRPLPRRDDVAEDVSQKEKVERANQLREKGNLAVKSNRFKEALDLYSSDIALSSGDYRLFFNRAFFSKYPVAIVAFVVAKPNYTQLQSSWKTYKRQRFAVSGCGENISVTDTTSKESLTTNYGG